MEEKWVVEAVADEGFELWFVGWAAVFFRVKKKGYCEFLLVSLVLGQIQVEAKTCCPTTAALNFYNACRILGSSKKTCASLGGCKIISGNTCSKNYIYETLGNNGGDAVNEYCKLGCTSSMCDPLTTLQDSNASEVVNEAVEKCTKACFAICTKGRSITATTTPVEIA
ncbi:thionin [Cannabis sativa]|uniref:thionin n=1 Tax=Cannabis sativa TaxID=3483 RepID=UPI0011DF51B6|nr:thionin [Cannabis sativa]